MAHPETVVGLLDRHTQYLVSIVFMLGYGHLTWQDRVFCRLEWLSSSFPALRRVDLRVVNSTAVRLPQRPATLARRGSFQKQAPWTKALLHPLQMLALSKPRNVFVPLLGVSSLRQSNSTFV